MKFDIWFVLNGLEKSSKNPGASEALEAIKLGLKLEDLDPTGWAKDLEVVQVPLEDLEKPAIQAVFSQRSSVIVNVYKDIYKDFLFYEWNNSKYIVRVNPEQIYQAWVQAGCPLVWGTPEPEESEEEEKFWENEEGESDKDW